MDEVRTDVSVLPEQGNLRGVGAEGDEGVFKAHRAWKAHERKLLGTLLAKKMC